MWNYRIVKYVTGDGFGLHEVYYDDAGQPWAMTERPATFQTDESEDENAVRRMLQLALDDAQKRPVLVEPRKGQWPGKAPALDEPNGLVEETPHTA